MKKLTMLISVLIIFSCGNRSSSQCENNADWPFFESIQVKAGGEADHGESRQSYRAQCDTLINGNHWFEFYSQILPDCKPCYVRWEDSTLYRIYHRGQEAILSFKMRPLIIRAINREPRLSYVFSMGKRKIYRSGLEYFEISIDSGFLASSYLRLDECGKWNIESKRGSLIINSSQIILDKDSTLSKVELGYSMFLSEIGGQLYVNPNRDSILIKEGDKINHVFEPSLILGKNYNANYCIHVKDDGNIWLKTDSFSTIIKKLW